MRHKNATIAIGPLSRKGTAKHQPLRCVDLSDVAIPHRNTSQPRDSYRTVATQGYSGAHFATFPTELIEPCILAGAPAGGVVLDPFFGSGTTGEVAQNLGRAWIGLELNPEYEPLQRERLRQPGLVLEVA